MSSIREITETKDALHDGRILEARKTSGSGGAGRRQGGESGLGLVFRWAWKHLAAGRLVMGGSGRTVTSGKEVVVGGDGEGMMGAS